MKKLHLSNAAYGFFWGSLAGSLLMLMLYELVKNKLCLYHQIVLKNVAILIFIWAVIALLISTRSIQPDQVAGRHQKEEHRPEA